ncbi:nitroreductase [Neisseriaceae bacterium PsAf]|nr:nitroreductase [Neisseriaceae bacterium PsAf]MCV2502903.1 nitroreductase family protein [Neisseriaceae bacterium]
MDALELLLNRQSHRDLGMPVPEGEILETILAAGLKVPDHGQLNPYRFTVIRQNRMSDLKEVLLSAVEELDLLPNKISKAQQICSESPMIIVVTAVMGNNSSIPDWEKMITAGCAAYAIQLAAKTFGFDSFWFTGVWTESKAVHKALGLEIQDKIIGFIKIGTKINEDRECENQPLSNFVNYF